MMLIIEIVITLSAVCALALIINKIEDRYRDKRMMSFKEALELTGMPIATFSLEGKKVHLLLDTGSNKSILNKKIADKLNISAEGKENATLYGAEGISKDGYIAPLTIQYNNKDYEERFQIVDMTSSFRKVKADTGVTLHGILGTSFLEKYNYVLDFKEMIAYSKK